MTEKHAGAWARTSRIIKAPPEKLYEAFMDPAVLIAWLPPAEMTGKIHEFQRPPWGQGNRIWVLRPLCCRQRRESQQSRQMRLPWPQPGAETEVPASDNL